MSTVGTEYNSYRDYLNQVKYDANTGVQDTDKTGTTTWNAVFAEDEKQTVSVDDFLTLMVAQLTNQDFMNPVDDTQFVTQLAQFSTMQQMSEMAGNMKNNYLLSLVGQTVTCAKFGVSGNVVKQTGPVERVVLANDEFALYVNGERFSLSQIMELGAASGGSGAEKPDTDADAGSDKGGAEAEGAGQGAAEGTGAAGE